ncbi:MAG: DUF2007 domain-containing protein [Muribaculaceae bacterium]
MNTRHDNRKLATLGEYENSVEANMVKGVLETNGVHCIVVNDMMSSILPLAPLKIGMVKVMVFEQELSLARNILASAPAEEEMQRQ